MTVGAIGYRSWRSGSATVLVSAQSSGHARAREGALVRLPLVLRWEEAVTDGCAEAAEWAYALLSVRWHALNLPPRAEGMWWLLAASVAAAFNPSPPTARGSTKPAHGTGAPFEVCMLWAGGCGTATRRLHRSLAEISWRVGRQAVAPEALRLVLAAAASLATLAFP